MKFTLSRASAWMGEKKTEIEINTLEELMGLIKKYDGPHSCNSLVVSEKEIVFYDDYLE
jgi:hypothetical protein